MIRRAIPLYDKRQSVDEVRRLARTYAADLDSFLLNGRPATLATIAEFHNAVRRIPYRRDPVAVVAGEEVAREVVARPAHLLNHATLGMDCKKKCVLMLAFAHRRGIPARIVTSSRRPDRRHHHIFPQYRIDGRWVNVDATYPEMAIGDGKKLTDYTVWKA